MGTVFKPIVTRPLPAGAEITEREGKRVARWCSPRGGVQTAPVRKTPRGDCVAVEVTTYLARFKDGAGITRTVATGCRDLMAARAVLADLERRAELVRSGVMTSAQDAVSTHSSSTIASHVEDYLASLAAKGTTETHRKAVRRALDELIEGCNVLALRDIKREPVERWLTRGANARRSARTRNSYLNTAKWFCNWAVDAERMTANPLARIPRADEHADRRRQPRALTPDELRRLLDAARRRPLEEALRFNRGWRKGQAGAGLRPETRAKLEALGRERALTYKVLALTGLRLGELASLRVCDVDLAASQLVLDAKHEKNRRGSSIPLRADLRDDLAAWIAKRAPGELLLRVTGAALKVFNRDLKHAGIAKRDDRGRTACIHALRHSFATWLSQGGVAPRVAQAAMRHSTIDLTMSVYTDPRLLDVAGAMAVLPELPLAAGLATEAKSAS